MTLAPEIRRLSVQDYHRMAEAGILAPDERIELIEGQLFQMAPKGTLHSATITRIKRMLEARLGDRALLRFQDPVRLSNDSEPEPDVAVVQVHPLDYEDHHPEPEEIYWVIEVSDRTLKRDRELKVPAYARSGVAECWVLDLKTSQLYVYCQPSSNGYLSEQVNSASDFVVPSAFPDCQFLVSDFLKPTA